MNLKKNNFLPKNNYKRNYTTFCSSPFSNINITRIKSEIKNNVLEFKEKEEKCISLIDFNIISELKKQEKQNKNKINNPDDTLSNSSRKSKEYKKEMESLNKKDKNTFSTLYSFHKKSKSFFPFIKRNQKKLNTFSIFNNINNVKLNDLKLDNPNNEKINIKSGKLNIYYFSDNYNSKKELISSNSLSNLSNGKNNKNSKLSELFNNKTKLRNSNYKINNYFLLQNNIEENIKGPIIDIKKPLKKSYSSFNSSNFKYLSNITNNFEFHNYQKKLNLNNLSNKTLSNLKSLSIIKSSENNKESFNKISKYNSNKSNIFLTTNNNKISSDNNKDDNNSSSFQSKNSFYEKNLKLQSPEKNDNLKNETISIKNNFSSKNQKKLFKLKIIKNINELEKNLKNNYNEHEKNKKNKTLLIKLLIKKCKYVLKIIDEKMNYDIENLIKEYDKNEVYMNLNQKVDDLQLIIKKRYDNIKKYNNYLKYKKINKNRHIIYNLIDKNNQIDKKVNNYIDKLLEKSNS